MTWQSFSPRNSPKILIWELGTFFFYLGGGNLLYFQRIVEQGGGREVLSDIIFEDLHTHVWVVDLGSDPKLEEPL